MKRLLGRFGTDSRFPYWSGAVLDPKFVNGGTALAMILSWGTLPFVHRSLTSANWSSWTLIEFGLATLVCVATTQLIRHPDAYVRNVVGAIACGLPLTVLLLLAWRGLTGV